MPSFRFKPKMPEKIVVKIVDKCQDSQRHDECGANAYLVMYADTLKVRDAVMRYVEVLI